MPKHDEREFYNCPYCKSAKDKETSAKIDEKRRFLRVIYTCGTDVELTWVGDESDAKFHFICVPNSKIN